MTREIFTTFVIAFVAGNLSSFCLYSETNQMLRYMSETPDYRSFVFTVENQINVSSFLELNKNTHA